MERAILHQVVRKLLKQLTVRKRVQLLEQVEVVVASRLQEILLLLLYQLCLGKIVPLRSHALQEQEVSRQALNYQVILLTNCQLVVEMEVNVRLIYLEDHNTQVLKQKQTNQILLMKSKLRNNSKKKSYKRELETNKFKFTTLKEIRKHRLQKNRNNLTPDNTWLLNYRNLDKILSQALMVWILHSTQQVKRLLANAPH